MEIESKMRTTIDEETSAELNDSVGRMSPAFANRVSTARRSLTDGAPGGTFWHSSAQF
jgi:hypothetical protein